MDYLIMKKFMHQFIMILAAGLVSLLCAQTAICLAGPPSTVAVLPFKIDAAQDLAYIKEGIRNMLCSRLSFEDKVVVVDRHTTKKASGKTPGDINPENACEIGKKLKADYVLFGGLTIVEESIAFDAMVIDVSMQKPCVVLRDQGEGMDTVIPIINELARKINSQLWGRSEDVGKESNFLQTPSVSDIYLHPDRLLESEKN